MCVDEVAMKYGSVLLPIVLACAGLVACRSTDAQPVEIPPSVVVANPLVMRLSEWDEYTGRFEATDRVAKSRWLLRGKEGADWRNRNGACFSIARSVHC
jgi:hypothetical protein